MTSVVSKEVLDKIILEKSVNRGGIGIGRYGPAVVIERPTPNIVVEIPGSSMLTGVAFFSQPNPLANKVLAPFNVPMVNPPNAFPPPTYQHNIIANDANNPLVFPAVNPMQPEAAEKVEKVERKDFPMKEDMRSAMVPPVDQMDDLILKFQKLNLN